MPDVTKFRISVNKYAENSKALRTKEDYGRRWRYFEKWCTAHGLCSLPASPHTLALFLFAHFDDWSPGTQNGIVWAIVDRHRAACHPDPSDDREVIELRRAVARAKGTRAQHVKDPLRADVLASLMDQPFDFADQIDELRTLRLQISAILTRTYNVSLPVQASTLRSAVQVDAARMQIDLPGECLGRKTRAGRALVLQRAGGTAHLADLIVRYLGLLPDRGEFPLFAWAASEGRVQQCSPVTARPTIATSLRKVAKRAGVVWSKDGTGLSDGEFARMLRCCNRGYLHDLRDRTMITVGWGTAMRPSEICCFDYPDVREVAEGYELRLDKSKMNQCGEPEIIPVHHWPGCPPVCPACALRFWLEESGITSGPLFPCAEPALGSRRCHPWAITAAIRHLAQMAALTGDWSAKSLRSGHITSRAEANEDLEEIRATSRHKTEEVSIIHYVLSRAGAGHHLGKGSKA